MSEVKFSDLGVEGLLLEGIKMGLSPLSASQKVAKVLYDLINENKNEVEELKQRIKSLENKVETLEEDKHILETEKEKNYE